MNDKDIPIQINKGYNTRKLQQQKKKMVHFTLNSTGNEILISY